MKKKYLEVSPIDLIESRRDYVNSAFKDTF